MEACWLLCYSAFLAHGGAVKHCTCAQTAAVQMSRECRHVGEMGGSSAKAVLTCRRFLLTVRICCGES